MKKLLIFIVTHGIALAVGFAVGIYALPILIAPESPSMETVTTKAAGASFTAEFRRDLQDSDALHWGEGEVFISDNTIAFAGKLAPGPDYQLYLAKEFVETEAKFKQLKPQMTPVGAVKTFENFVVDLPAGVDPSEYNTVIVWCESFEQFITSARYQAAN